MSAFFVTGAGTELGKTHVAEALLRAWRDRGLRPDAFKPVMSGFDPADPTDSDAGRLIAALDRPLNDTTLAAMAPWRFAAPLAPPLAAAKERATLNQNAIIEACQARVAAASAPLLIEGAGGIMAPLTENATNLDLMVALGLPAIFVTGSYLGAVSHGLTGLAVLRHAGLELAAIVVSESETPGASLSETADMLSRHGACETPIILAPRSAETSIWARELADAAPLDGPDTR
ncbi:MAG: dethiobiotin synthase [Maricaulaceae bacterium]